MEAGPTRALIAAPALHREHAERQTGRLPVAHRRNGRDDSVRRTAVPCFRRAGPVRTCLDHGARDRRTRRRTPARACRRPSSSYHRREIGVHPCRDETRREHFQELRAYLTLFTFGLRDCRSLVHSLADLAMQTDKGMVLASQSFGILRQQRIILPAITVIERACAEAVTRANRRIYRALLEPLQPHHKRGLDNLLNVTPDTNITWLMWLYRTATPDLYPRRAIHLFGICQRRRRNRSVSTTAHRTGSHGYTEAAPSPGIPKSIPSRSTSSRKEVTCPTNGLRSSQPPLRAGTSQ